MNILSLFDGLGGARIALDRLSIPCKYYASEIDKYAIKIALKNYPDIIQLGDIKDIKTKELPKIDLLIGGSPCQDLSIAKKNRKGLRGKRSGLFWKYVRLLKELKPKYFLLENVNSMKKTDKQIITDTLKVEPIMINSALLTAQNRKRLYWTNILNIKQPEDKGLILKDILEKNVDEKYFLTELQLSKLDLTKINDLRKRTWKCGKHQQDIIQNSLGKSSTIPAGTHASTPHLLKTLLIHNIKKWGMVGRIYSIDGKSCTLKALGGGGGAKTGLYAIPHGYIKATHKQVNKYPTLCGQSPASKHLVSIKDYVRKLTPIECERLQGLPDNYTEGVSNTQRYKMIGNGFTIPVIAHILKGIK